MKFAVTIWNFYNFQIKKKIVSAETICGNTVYIANIVCKKVEIKKRCYWKCVLSPSNRPNQQIKPHQTRWHYPLLTYLSKKSSTAFMFNKIFARPDSWIRQLVFLEGSRPLWHVSPKFVCLCFCFLLSCVDLCSIKHILTLVIKLSFS